MEHDIHIETEHAVMLLRKLADILEGGRGGEVAVGDLKVTIPPGVETGIDYTRTEHLEEFDVEISWTPGERGKEGSYRLFTGANGKWYFSLRASNGQVVLASEAYESRQGAEAGIESVRASAKEGAFDRRTSVAGQPYFVLKAGNHEIIGVSQMYKSNAGRDRGIASVIAHAEKSPVKEA